MKSIGIIANPASGRDIRRLVAQGSVFSNMEKTNIVRRVLLAAEAMGVRKALLMPDREGMSRRVLDGLGLSLAVDFTDTQSEGEAADSEQAARAMRQAGVALIVTLGGDGTNRVVAKQAGEVPLLAISTGTNNVFPRMMEGTLAGLAAGVLAAGLVDPALVCRPQPRLDLLFQGQFQDLALIDLVVTDDEFTGAKAVWKSGSIKEVFLSRLAHAAIGFSALGGFLGARDLPEGHGLHLVLGPGGQKVLAPIGPGKVEEVAIARWRPLAPGQPLSIEQARGVIALDGEREVYLEKGSQAQVVLRPDGPLLLDVPKTLEMAAQAGCFLR